MVLRVLALVAALVLSLGLYATATADNRYQGMITEDNTPCADQNFEDEPTVLYRGDLVSVFPDHKTDEAQLIGIGPDGGYACWVPLGSVVAYSGIETTSPEAEPTVEPTLESTEVLTPDQDSTESTPVETEEATVEPTMEPTETMVDPTVEPEPLTDTWQEPEIVETSIPELEQDAMTLLPPDTSSEATDASESVSGNAHGVTALPSTGSGPSGTSVDEQSIVEVVLGAILLAVIIVIAFVGCIVIVWLPYAWRDYKDGVSTGASRLIQKVLGHPYRP